MELKPIGFLKSCYPDKFGTPRQSGLVRAATAELKLLPEFQPELSLQGLEEFSHLWVIFHFHKNTNLIFRPKVHPPRMGGKSAGVFATRSPHRPNPIGLSLAKIERIEKGTLFLSGLDLIEGTPIFDIKPYLPYSEALKEARGSWTDLETSEISVEWDDQALAVTENWAQESGRPRLKELVEGTLKLDPRPVIYRGFEGKSAENSKYRQTHAVRLFEGDVRFQFVEPHRARVLEVIPYYKPTE